MSDHLTPFPWLDVLLLLALIGLNAVLAMSELAIVSSREARLKAMARSGNSGAQCALDLAADPGRFLSTVQSGITLIAVFAGAFSGASLGGPVAERLQLLGLDPEAAHTVGFGLVIVLTTYVSLVIGEIVPKQIALRSPEPIAAVMSRPMRWLSKITAPFVWLLDKSSKLIFALLGLDRESKNQVTAEELHLVVAEAQTAGVLEESERAIISGIVRLADRPVREVMTPRTEVDWIDPGASSSRSARRCSTSQHTRLPDRRRLDREYRRRDPGPRRARRRAPGPPDRASPPRPDRAGDSRFHGCDGCARRAAPRRRSARAGPRRIWPPRRHRDAWQHPCRACRNLRP